MFFDSSALGLGADEPELPVDPASLVNLNTNVQTGQFGPDFMLGLQVWSTPRRVYTTLDDMIAGRSQMPLAYLLGVLSPAFLGLMALRKLSSGENKPPRKSRRR